MATPLLDIETQHKDMIHDAQLDYYAKKLATCSSDTTVRIYDIHGDHQYQPSAELLGHDGPVWQVAWAHPKFGTVLASCSFDGKVIIHREQPAGKWQQIFVYQELQSSVNSIAWAPQEYDLCLACVTSDGKISVLSHNSNDMWNAKVFSGSDLGINSISWAPYGQSDKKRFVTGGCDKKVKVWVLEEDQWKVEHELVQHSDWVRDVAWAPSIGLPSSTIASCCEDGKVIIWSQSNESWVPKIIKGNSDKSPPVWRVSWSVTGSVLAISAGDSEVTLWKETLDGEWIQISDVQEATKPAPVAEPMQYQADYSQQQYQQDYSQPQQQQPDPYNPPHYQTGGSQQPQYNAQQGNMYMPPQAYPQQQAYPPNTGYNGQQQHAPPPVAYPPRY